MTEQHPIHAAPSRDRTGKAGDRPREAASGAADRRPSPRRDHLVAVATGLFCREGFHATGIDRVLAEAGVAKMTLYKHFPSKDDLIAACLDGVGEAARRDVLAVIAAGGRTPRAKVLSLIEWYAGVATDCEFQGCPFHHARAEFADPAHPAHAVARDQKVWLREQLQELCEAHGLRRADLAADQLLLVVEGALAMGALDTGVEIAEAAAGLARRVLEGSRRT